MSGDGQSYNSRSIPELGKYEIPGELLVSRYQQDLIKEYPVKIGYVTKSIKSEQIQLFRSISEATLSRLQEAAEVLQARVLRFLEPETLTLITHHLSRVDYILVCESSGEPPYSGPGITLRYKTGKLVIGLDLNYRGRPLSAERLASIVTHETVHVADPFGARLDYDEYGKVIRATHRESIEPADIETASALWDRREMGPRVMDGTLFGTETYDYSMWRSIYRRVVKLIERDQFRLLSQEQPE